MRATTLIKVLVLDPDGSSEVVECLADTVGLQAVVGGPFYQFATLGTGGDRTAVFFPETGREDRLPENLAALHVLARAGVLVPCAPRGRAVFVGAATDEAGSVPDEFATAVATLTARD